MVSRVLRDILDSDWLMMMSVSSTSIGHYKSRDYFLANDWRRIQVVVYQKGTNPF